MTFVLPDVFWILGIRVWVLAWDCCQSNEMLPPLQHTNWYTTAWTGEQSQITMPAAPLWPCRAVVYPIEKFSNTSYSLFERRGKNTAPNCFGQLYSGYSCIQKVLKIVLVCISLQQNSHKMVFFFFCHQMLVQPLSKKLMATHFS